MPSFRMTRLRPIVLLLAIVALMWASRHFELARRFDVEHLRTLVAEHAPYGPLLFVGVCVAVILLHLPAILPIAAGGTLFEAPFAFVLGWSGALIGATATFLLVRYLVRDAVRASLERRFRRLAALDERLATHGFRTVFLLRLALFLSPPLNWGLGATRVELRQYVLATALGVIPGVALAVYFADAILAESGGGESLVRLGILLTGLALGVLVGRRLMRTA